MLPRLTLEDLPAQRTPAPNTVSEIDGTVLLHQDVDTAGISYLTMYFSLSDFTAEELSRAAIRMRQFAEMIRRLRAFSEVSTPDALYDEVLRETGYLKLLEESTDQKDTTRAAAPLKKAEDAFEVDSGGMSIEETFGRLCEIVINRLAVSPEEKA